MVGAAKIEAESGDHGTVVQEALCVLVHSWAALLLMRCYIDDI